MKILEQNVLHVCGLALSWLQDTYDHLDKEAFAELESVKMINELRTGVELGKIQVQKLEE